MYKELKLYKSLCDTYDLEPHVAEKLIYEIRQEHSKLNEKKLFSEQSILIKKINSLLSKSVFSNFVPNYKSLATVYQIFNQETPVKKRVLLEHALIGKMSNKSEENMLKVKPIDIVRTSDSSYKDLNINSSQEKDDQHIIKAIIKNPKILQRPIIIKGQKGVIGRPPEKINELL